MCKIIVTTLAGLSLVAFAIPASAETRSVAVQYADLDLESSAGMVALESRIQAAVQKICGKAQVRNVHDGADQERCMRETQSRVSLELARLTGKRELARR
jgi:UrcA family protein